MLLVLAGDADELLQVFDPALRLDRAFGFEGRQVAAALEHALEQVGHVELERAGHQRLHQGSELAHSLQRGRPHSGLLAELERLPERDPVRVGVGLQARHRGIADPAPRLGYRTNFTIYDSADQLRLTKRCLEELDRDPKRFVPRGIHAQISTAKNNLVGPDEYKTRVASFYDQTVADTYELYQRRLFTSNAVDFDDLLYLTVDVLERFPEALDRWRKAFRYVLVDEYQDTNHAQYRLLQLLAGEHKNLFAVGDPDQSIYAFRGADIRNILEFERDFPGTRTIPLEQNYRSTNTILRAANHVIANNRERKPKNLFSELGEGDPVRVYEVEDEHAEARFVAAEIAGLVEEG
ncbi:MAG: hypothetical protein E6G38_08830, partial [Actinobacteria bacterium]